MKQNKPDTKNGLYWFVEGKETTCTRGFIYKYNEDGTVDITGDKDSVISHKIEGNMVTTSFVVEVPTKLTWYKRLLNWILTRNKDDE